MLAVEGICARMKRAWITPGLLTENPQGEIVDRLPREAQLILACARAGEAAVPTAKVRALLEQPLDWAYIHRIAFRNGQLPFLHLHLNRIAPERIPADTKQALQVFFDSHRDQNQFLLQMMLDLLSRFEQQGLAAMPYVEAISSFAAYGRPDLRTCTWLDFVIRPEDLAGAREVLRSNSGLVEQASVEGEARLLRRGANAVFGDGPRESAVSLHWAAAPWSRAVRLDIQELWTRPVGVSFAGKRLLSLAPEDALLHLCAQNSEYLWVTLQGIADIAELVRAHPGLDWDGMLARARESGMQRAVFVGMSLIQELLDVSLPESVAARIKADRAVTQLVVEIVGEMFVSAPHPNRTPEMLRFHVRLREGAADRARYLWRFLISPTEVDRKLLRLPAVLDFLYPWVRPARLAGSVVRRVAGRPIRAALRKPESVSGFSPSGVAVVNRMLELAEVRAGDVVFDLGCGDGRIVIQAAGRFGVRGVGIDLDPQRIRECRANARRAGVEDLVTFYHQDVMRADFSPATVVMMYLPPKASLHLTARLMKELPPGARIVSHNCDLGGWDKVEACVVEGFPSLLYLRRIPERQAAAGTGTA